MTEITEKQRRIYYQDIVYAVCNIIDRNVGGSLWVGSVDDPSTEVQDTLAKCRIRFRDGDDSQWMDADKVDDLGLWWWFNGEQVLAVEIGVAVPVKLLHVFLPTSLRMGWFAGASPTSLRQSRGDRESIRQDSQ